MQYFLIAFHQKNNKLLYLLFYFFDSLLLVGVVHRVLIHYI